MSINKRSSSAAATAPKRTRYRRRDPRFQVGEQVKVLRAHLEGDIRQPIVYQAIVQHVSRRVDSLFSDSVPFRYDVSTASFEEQTTTTATLGHLKYREPSVPEHFLFKLHESVPSGDVIEVPTRCPAPPQQQAVASIQQNDSYLRKQEADCSFVPTSTVPCTEHKHRSGQAKFRVTVRKELAQCLQDDVAQCRCNLAEEEDAPKSEKFEKSKNSSSSTTRHLTLVQGLPDTFILDFSKAKTFLSTLHKATLLDRDVVAVTKDGVTSVRDPKDDYAKTPVRVSMSCCSGTHEVGVVETDVRHLTDGEKESSSRSGVETTLGFKYTYAPLCENHVVSRCMPWRIRICLEELTALLRKHDILHHDVNACQLLTYDVRRGVSIGFHHDGSPSSSQAENSQLLGTSVLSITLGAPMDLVFAIEHKDRIDGMDEILSFRLSHGTVLSMGPITDVMFKHSARPCSPTNYDDHHKGMRHVFVCRALTIVKRFYGKGYGHPDFPFQLVPTKKDQEHRAAAIRSQLSRHPYQVSIDYLGGKYTGYVTGTSAVGNLEVWVPHDNSCVEVRSSSRVEFLNRRYPGF